MSGTSGTLPEGWTWARVKDTGSYINGFAFKPAHREPSGRPIIRIQNLTDPAKEFNRTTFGAPEAVRVEPGEILVSWSATLDAFIWNGEPALLNQHIFRVIPERELVTPRFLFYLLKESIWEMTKSEHLHGSTMRHINRGPFMAFDVPIPPKKEQVRIVDEIEKQFTRLDVAVGALKRVQANLKRYRAAVLKTAIEGRLVPTEAELARREGRFYQSASELLKRILADRRAAWDEEQLDRLRALGKAQKDDKWRENYREPESPDAANLPSPPEGWTWATVEQASSVVQYGSSAKTSEEIRAVPVLRMPNVTTDGGLNLDALKYLPADHDEFPDLLLRVGDLLFNRTNSPELVGKSAVYRGIPSPCSFASYLIRVRTIAGCSPSYLAYCLNSGMGRSWIRAVVAQQVGQANVNGSKLQAFVFPLPPAAEQERIVFEAERRLSTIDEIEMQAEANVKRADRLRQGILKRAFAGRLVPQDSTDEPASVLLERIRSERQSKSPSQTAPKVRRRKPHAAEVM